MVENPWIVSIEEELIQLPNDAEESERWRKQSIYKIPASITDLKTRAYKPQIVSIGPYHHGAEHLMAMEKHKRRALFHFLKRSKKRLTELVELLTPVVEDAKVAYDQLDSKWNKSTDQFLEMMILDGCFILEILRATKKRKNKVVDGNYASNDPIFSYHAMLYIFRNLRYDMLMLENQIPLFVLDKLGSVLNEYKFRIDYGVTMEILYFFSQIKSTRHIEEFYGCLHILDIHRRSLVLEPSIRKSRRKVGRRKQSWDLARFLGGDKQNYVIRSVTELTEAGITIKKNKSGSLTDITFRDRVLKLPEIVVDDALESLYLNLMAFERFHVRAGNEVTSYVYFMYNIISNAKDVNLLQSCGIIKNVLGSDMAVANVFNSLSSEATFDPDGNLAEVYNELIVYCQKIWPRWIAYFKRYYLTTPYATASAIATSILLVFTIAQTVFSVLSYLKPSHNA